jgi:hypothetical protein
MAEINLAPIAGNILNGGIIIGGIAFVGIVMAVIFMIFRNSKKFDFTTVEFVKDAFGRPMLEFGKGGIFTDKKVNYKRFYLQGKNASLSADKVPYIFRKYRRTLSEIEEGFLKTAVYDAFRLATNNYTAEQLISNRANFEIKVKQILVSQLQAEGFMLKQLTTNMVYPVSFKNAINAKNNAVQNALQAQNKVKQAEAEARIKIAVAEGDAQALLTRAKAEAQSNTLKQQTLTPMLLEQQRIEAWRKGGSQVPSYVGSGGEKFLMNIK